MPFELFVTMLSATSVSDKNITTSLLECGVNLCEAITGSTFGALKS